MCEVERKPKEQRNNRIEECNCKNNEIRILFYDREKAIKIITSVSVGVDMLLR